MRLIIDFLKSIKEKRENLDHYERVVLRNIG